MALGLARKYPPRQRRGAIGAAVGRTDNLRLPPAPGEFREHHGIVFATAQIAIDFRIRAIRESTAIPISSLPRTDPIRRHFGALHGISSILLLAQIVVAGGAVATDTES